MTCRIWWSVTVEGIGPVVSTITYLLSFECSGEKAGCCFFFFSTLGNSWLAGPAEAAGAAYNVCFLGGGGHYFLVVIVDVPGLLFLFLSG